jgi:hypothetical protein
MILPPLPQGYENKPWDYKGPIWIESQMQAYALLAIKQHFGKGKRGPKFSAKDVAYIRELYAQGFAYKAVSRQIEMSETTFFKIVHRRGAYK